VYYYRCDRVVFDDEELMAGRVILETERLTLREFDDGDVQAFYILGSDPAITQFTGDPGLTSLGHAREVLRSRPLADYRKYGFGRWACVYKQNGGVIGFAGLKFLEDLKEVDIGYRLLPAYWGVGLATEAGRAVLDYGFAELHLEEIIGLVDPTNVASVRVLEKLGLSFDRVMEYQGADVARYVIHLT
jgi:RimJ/RimL family protein N-acetyltransferase